MKRLTAILLLMTVLLCGCGRTQSEVNPAAEEGGTVLWFASQGGASSAALGSERRDLGNTPTVQTLMAVLLRGPESEQLISPFPRGVYLRSFELSEDGVLRVDLSEQYDGLSGFDLTVADCCIALTLCQLETVKSVCITVEGKELPYRNRQVLSPGDIMLTDLAQTPEEYLAVLSFPKRDGSGLVQEYRTIPRESNSDIAALIAEQLLTPPQSGEGTSPLPAGTGIRSARVSGGLCRLDLTAEFVERAPEDEAYAALNLRALVTTLCDMDGVDRVQLLAEGTLLEEYGGISMEVPFSETYSWGPFPQKTANIT